MPLPLDGEWKQLVKMLMKIAVVGVINRD